LAFVAGDLGDGTVFDHEGTRQDEPGDFGISEFTEQSPDIAVDGLGPDLFPGIEVTADQRRVDAWINGRGVKGGQATFGVAAHADPGSGVVVAVEPIHGGEDGLHFVADDVSAQVKRLSVNPFPSCLVGFAKLGIVGLQFFAADGLGQDEEKSILGESSHTLGRDGNPGR
jgi:hypothetical protein